MQFYILRKWVDKAFICLHCLRGWGINFQLTCSTLHEPFSQNSQRVYLDCSDVFFFLMRESATSCYRVWVWVFFYIFLRWLNSPVTSLKDTRGPYGRSFLVSLGPLQKNDKWSAGKKKRVTNDEHIQGQTCRNTELESKSQTILSNRHVHGRLRTPQHVVELSGRMPHILVGHQKVKVNVQTQCVQPQMMHFTSA